jgi:hypothetical protein
LKRLAKAIKGIDANANPIDFCRAVLGDARISIIGGEHMQVLVPNNKKQQIRYTLYSIYELFLSIQSKLKEKRKLDAIFLKRVKSGEILSNDPRFEEIRKISGAEHDNRKMIEIELTDSDNEWFREIYFGNFLREEATLLPQLVETVTKRVAARKDGLTAIFP